MTKEQDKFDKVKPKLDKALEQITADEIEERINVDEQEEAIEILEKMIKSYIEADECGLSNNDFKYEIRAMQTVLSMLRQKDKKIEKKDKIIEKFEKELNKISEKNVDLINKYTELKLVLAYICRIGISIDDVEMEKFIKEANNFTIRVERDIANRRTTYKTIL